MPAAPTRQTIDPLEAIIADAQSADKVLPGVSRRATVAFNGSPLDYLRYRNSKPISHRQYRAGVYYAAMIETLSATGSNAGGIFKNGNLFVPATGVERERRAMNRQMKAGVETKPVSDPTPKLIDAIDRLKRVDGSMGMLTVHVLRDLLERNIPVGQIGARYGTGGQEMGFFVRVALWDLVRALETHERDFLEESMIEAELRGQ